MAKRWLWFASLSSLLLVLEVELYFLTLRGNGDKQNDLDDVPPVREFGEHAEQVEAIEEALKIDLPLIKKADKVVIELIDFPAKPKHITLRNPSDIKELRQALKPWASPISGGVAAAILWFYHRDRLLRKIWVFDQGEWGIVRPGVMSPTTGRDEHLWKVIQKRVR